MEIVKSWCLNICATLTIAVIFSLLSPKGSMGKYMKIIIALFVTVSIILPLSNIDKNDFISTDFENCFTSNENNNETYESLIEAQIKSLLSSNGIKGSNISCKLNINNDEIEVKEITVSIIDEYSIKDVENMIYENLGYVAQVKYIGQ